MQASFIHYDFAFSRKQLQQEFLDHGVLTLLKNWLEPLPDGSLPNINIRAAILKILNDVCAVLCLLSLVSFVKFWAIIEHLNFASFMQFPIDLEQYDRREQLKKSGLGKVRV